MNAIINLGNPRKDMSAIIRSTLGTCSTQALKITGIDVFRANGILITSPTYGAGMTLDALCEMTDRSLIGSDDRALFVGSMGSLSGKIKKGEIVIPDPIGCAYYGFDGMWLEQDEDLLNALSTLLAEGGIEAITYKHGSSFAVFDPHTDHINYTNTLYDEQVLGIDCGEVFIGIDFATRHQMKGGAVLYCSDSPDAHITDIGEEEFANRAFDLDLFLNQLAVAILNSGDPRT
ncbi:MAG TPA: hypothetical protein VJ875_25470 [Pyrinomonadaceae bacterium]|nr:hypothetical protein [Pyrinomonadaceae bacterium]